MATKTITIEKPFGGLINPISGTNSATYSASAEGAQNQYASSTGVSLFRLEKVGDIAPGETFTAITDSGSYIVGLATNAAVASNGIAFMVLQNGRIIKTNTSGNATTDYYVPVAHGGQTISTTTSPDMIVIKDASSTPVEWIVSTWEDGGGADAMIIKPDGTSKTSDWFSQGNSANYLVALVPHKITQGPDGNIAITNGQHIATATMASGVGLGSATRNTQALNLGAGWTSFGITNYQNFYAIVGHQATSQAATPAVSKGMVRVWLWDGFSPEPNFVYNIQDNLSRGIYFDGTSLRVYTCGRGNAFRVWEFNGSGFQLIIENPSLGIGTDPLQGAIEYYQSSNHFATDTDRIYQLYQNGLHNRMVITDGTNQATAVGFLKNLYQSQLFVSVNTSGGYKIYYQSSFDTYYVNADFRSRLFTRWDDGTPIRKGKIRKIHVWFSQFGSGASIIMSLLKSFNGISIGGANDLLNKTLAASSLGTSVRYISFEVSIDDLESFYMNVRFNHASISNTAAIIRRIIIEADETDVY